MLPFLWSSSSIIIPNKTGKGEKERENKPASVLSTLVESWGFHHLIYQGRETFWSHTYDPTKKYWWKRERQRRREKSARVCGMVDYDHGRRWDNQVGSVRVLVQQRLKWRTRTMRDPLCTRWSDPRKPISGMIWSSLILLFHDHVLGGAPPCSLVVGDSLFHLPWPWKSRHGLF